MAYLLHVWYRLDCLLRRRSRAKQALIAHCRKTTNVERTAARRRRRRPVWRHGGRAHSSRTPHAHLHDCGLNYVLQHLVVLGIALTRRPPAALDRSLSSNAAVFVAYAYPYAQVIYLRWVNGTPAWPEAGLVLVTLAACLSLASLLTLGRFFGIRPALRGLATKGPYRVVRHPMYLSYMMGDIG